MDILIYIIGMLIIIALFTLTTTNRSPFVFVSIFFISIIFFSLSISNPAEVIVGKNETYICGSTHCPSSPLNITNIITTDVTEDVPILNTGFLLFYIMSAIGSLLLWIGYKEKDEYDDL